MKNFLQSRAILASTIEVVNKINEFVLSLISGDEKDYLNFDSIDKSNALQNPAFKSLTP